MRAIWIHMVLLAIVYDRHKWHWFWQVFLPWNLPHPAKLQWYITVFVYIQLHQCNYKVKHILLNMLAAVTKNLRMTLHACLVAVTCDFCLCRVLALCAMQPRSFCQIVRPPGQESFWESGSLDLPWTELSNYRHFCPLRILQQDHTYPQFRESGTKWFWKPRHLSHLNFWSVCLKQTYNRKTRPYSGNQIGHSIPQRRWGRCFIVDAERRCFQPTHNTFHVWHMYLKSKDSCGYGSIPIDTCLVGWTSINPSYFGVH